MGSDGVVGQSDRIRLIVGIGFKIICVVLHCLESHI